MYERSAGRQAGSPANVCEHLGFRLAVLRRLAGIA
jgi:hypothetical protein